MKPLLKLTFLVALAFSLNLRARAETVDFPSDAPAFTVTVPNGWESTAAGEMMMLTKGEMGEGMVIALGKIPDNEVDSMKAAKDSLAKMAAEMTAGGMKPSAAAMEIALNGKVKAVAQEYQGKDPSSGKDSVLTVAAFTADGKHFYSLMITGTKEQTKATNAEQTAIMKSITPK